MYRIVGGCSGYVNCVHADGTFDINIRFTISCTVEKNVHPRRILNSNPLATSARRRSSIMMMPQQDLLSCLPAMSRLLGVAAYLQLQLRPMFQQLPQSTLGNNNFRSLPIHIHQVLLHCTDWNPFRRMENPLMAMLEWGKKRRPAGWGARVEDSGESIWRRRTQQASVFTDRWDVTLFTD